MRCSDLQPILQGIIIDISKWAFLKKLSVTYVISIERLWFGSLRQREPHASCLKEKVARTADRLGSAGDQRRRYRTSKPPPAAAVAQAHTSPRDTDKLDGRSATVTTRWKIKYVSDDFP
ncbi:hypothetical protein EVAR_82458_1 [Eumeta japonica]|uniref:Uncharacterized protein n=1 Tax=Eumeta variegata TaxID=151549 RepID=A0A4C1X437_EUMVA|nr:hypothetical protein EVAR_82458_1 [Eumeta japonica]